MSNFLMKPQATTTKNQLCTRPSSPAQIRPRKLNVKWWKKSLKVTKRLTSHLCLKTGDRLKRLTGCTTDTIWGITTILNLSKKILRCLFKKSSERVARISWQKTTSIKCFNPPCSILTEKRRTSHQSGKVTTKANSAKTKKTLWF